MTISIREPVNGFTHLFGAVMAFAGLFALVIKASAVTEDAVAMMAVIIFGVSMILLYAASATYHMVVADDRVIAFLRRMDHSMIFVLIAGTYAPFCLISLSGSTGWVLFTFISFIALAGVTFKLVWFHAPRWLSTALYVAMGWLVIFFTPQLAPVIGAGGMVFLILGGIIYTIGALIYWLKPKILTFKHFGYHEIFHIFILFGSLFHFVSIYFYVL